MLTTTLYHSLGVRACKVVSVGVIRHAQVAMRLFVEIVEWLVCVVLSFGGIEFEIVIGM